MEKRENVIFLCLTPHCVEKRYAAVQILLKTEAAAPPHPNPDNTLGTYFKNEHNKALCSERDLRNLNEEERGR